MPRPDVAGDLHPVTRGLRAKSRRKVRQVGTFKSLGWLGLKVHDPMSGMAPLGFSQCFNGTRLRPHLAWCSRTPM